ncbi:replicative DNA helicase [Bacillus weihaiensis]|uniref:DNA 5'-3' helicase n=1 Tax=Bacillus weihaiensis TaxID=1547283 RepID=A0A1L3MRC5_9BACI|nr:replicative DNA helicase [Bacillus weihaiensis]APH04925.1 DNA helicase [Bacillus weihaiensis]
MKVVEKAFIGTLMKADFLLKDTILVPEHLESTVHQQLMKRMLDLQRDGKGIDLLSLTTLHDLEAFGGMSYLSELQSYADPEKFEEMETLILGGWKEREKKNILALAAINDWEITKVISELDKISQMKLQDHTSIEQALATMYEAPWEEQPFCQTATTGIQKLDDITGGFQDGEVTILAGRPSMGKTDVMLHLAKASGWSGYLPLIYSLEMPAKLITKRLIASTAGINRLKLRDPKKLLSEKQKNQWSDAIGKLNKTTMQIFDDAGQTVAEIRAKTRKIMNLYPNKKPILFIDYLTLIQPKETYVGNTHLQVTEISKALKALAKDFQCPVICLAQLNRSVETRADKRPMMSDIRESGSVEQDADVILFLYREAYYEKETKNHTLEIIVSKNRNGPIGTIAVTYNEYTGSMEEL